MKNEQQPNDHKKIGGIAILYIGITGAGKSSIVKQNIRNVHASRLLVYDVQREYFQYENDDDDLPDIEQFQDQVSNMRRGHAIFEEATRFFSNRGRDEKMLKILIDKRHHENTIHLCFHSIRSVPSNIFDLVNYAYILQTNDTPDVVESRYPKLFNAWNTVNNNPQVAQKFLLRNGKHTPYMLVKTIETAKLL